MPGSVAVLPAAKLVPPTLNEATARRSPSGSLSFVSRLPETGVSSAVLATSARASGASLTGVTAIWNVPVDEVAPPSSVTVKSMCAGPLKSGAGRNSSVSPWAGVSTWPATTGVVPLASSSVPLDGRATTVTPVMTPSRSVPRSEIGRVLSSRPLALPGVATGGALPASGFCGATGCSVTLARSAAVTSAAAGVSVSTMRSTRRPGCRSPSPPARPAPGVISISPSGGISTTRVPGDGSSVSCTMPSCVVRITSPRCTSSPSLSACILPSAPRSSAEPQRPVTLPWEV